MGWSYSFWINKLYPSGTPARKFLSEYAKHFDTVEADSTFYRLPSEKTISTWKSETPQSFRFAAKFPRLITHTKMLKDSERNTRFFVTRLSPLKEKLGPLLVQLPPQFTFGHLAALKRFLETLPEQHRYALEVRNKTLLIPEVFSLLKEHNVALAIVDKPSLSFGEKLTADFAYVRWEGDRKTVRGTIGEIEIDRSKDTQEWAKRLKRFENPGTEAFGYFSKYYSGYPPADADLLLAKLRN